MLRLIILALRDLLAPFLVTVSASKFSLFALKRTNLQKMFVFKRRRNTLAARKIKPMPPQLADYYAMLLNKAAVCLLVLTHSNSSVLTHSYLSAAPLTANAPVVTCPQPTVTTSMGHNVTIECTVTYGEGWIGYFDVYITLSRIQVREGREFI